eukprot:gene12388-15581_t
MLSTLHRNSSLIEVLLLLFRQLDAGFELGYELEVSELVVLISHYNAHDFFGHNNSPAGNLIMPGGVVPKAPYTALFEIGSKVEHSCFPNVTYSSKSGQLVYTATQAIAAGERVTFSYIPYIEVPEQARRNALFMSKSFLCECARCEGPDMCRPLQCPDCKDGVVLRTSPRWSALISRFAASEAAMLADAPPAHRGKMLRVCGTLEDLRCEAAAFAIEQVVWCERMQALLAGRAKLDATWQMPGTKQRSTLASRSGRRPLSPEKRLFNIMYNDWLASSGEVAILMPFWGSCKEVFYAGKDLMDVGRSKQAIQAAAIFRRYHAALLQWAAPGDPDRHYIEQINSVLRLV